VYIGPPTTSRTQNGSGAADHGDESRAWRAALYLATAAIAALAAEISRVEDGGRRC
jgi:hypothetical protein